MIDPGIVNLASRGDSSSMATLRVDVISDLICPWCYLGKRRLDDALASVHGPSQVSWFPFQLNPEMPETGMDFDAYLSARFGSADTVRPGIDRLLAAGQKEGIRFRFDRIKRVPNTLNAHRVLQLSEREGTDTSQLAERLMQGFFEDGQDISDRNVLVHLGEDSGLRAADIHQTLADDTSLQIVLSQEAQVRKSGVTGVPDFLINKRLFVTGAQETEVLVSVFDRAMFGEESEQPVSAIVH
jgi:predicted DsbA family dithiol-disulfide isomerase